MGMTAKIYALVGLFPWGQAPVSTVQKE